MLLITYYLIPNTYYLHYLPYLDIFNYYIS